MPYKTLTTNPSIYPLHLSSPNDLCCPGLVDVGHQETGRPFSSRPPPRNRVDAAGRWVAKQVMCTGSSPWPDRYGFTRVTSSSPRTTVSPPSPILHPIALQWSELTGRVIIKKKTRRHLPSTMRLLRRNPTTTLSLC